MITEWIKDLYVLIYKYNILCNQLKAIRHNVSWEIGKSIGDSDKLNVQSFINSLAIKQKRIIT